MSNTTFIDVDICHQNRIIAKPYSATLTSNFVVKIANIHYAVPADLPPLERHPPSSCYCLIKTMSALDEYPLQAGVSTLDEYPLQAGVSTLDEYPLQAGASSLDEYPLQVSVSTLDE